MSARLAAVLAVAVLTPAGAVEAASHVRHVMGTNRADTLAGTATGKGLVIHNTVNINSGNFTVGTANIANNDVAKLTDYPDTRFRAGTSEIKNWIILAGAMAGDGLQMNLVDYVPCYRSEAGTGNAMCFAYWE